MIIPIIYEGSYFDRNVINIKVVDSQFDISRKRNFSYQSQQSKLYKKSMQTLKQNNQKLNEIKLKRELESSKALYNQRNSEMAITLQHKKQIKPFQSRQRSIQSRNTIQDQNSSLRSFRGDQSQRKFSNEKYQQAKEQSLIEMRERRQKIKKISVSPNLLKQGFRLTVKDPSKKRYCNDNCSHHTILTDD